MTLAPLEKKPDRPTFELKIPRLAALIATNDPNGTIRGIDDLQRDSQARYAQYERDHGRDPTKAEYYPVIGVTYWSFRLMMGLGLWMGAFAVAGLLVVRRSKVGLEGMAQRTWFRRLALFTLSAGFLGHAFGWIFTEMGRQPWAVTGLLKTQDAVSRFGAENLVISLTVFVVLYVIIGAIEFRLFARLAQKGPDPLDPENGSTDDPLVPHSTPALSY
jgi:cytochrome d ubiquinol oxidase subunit I